MIKEIIYYTDNRLDPGIMSMCQWWLLKAGLPIISSSLEPISFGDNKVMEGKRGYLTMFRQIVDCLKRSYADVVFFCEHDVVYHPTHFDFRPQRKDIYYYNNNVWKYNGREAVSYDCRWLSQLCCYRDLALRHFETKLAFEAAGIRRRFEPGTRRGIDDNWTMQWESTFPNMDIRHGKNLTGVSRFNLSDFKKKPKNFIREDFVPYYGAIDLNSCAQ